MLFILVLTLLTLVNAFFAAVEIAYVSVRKIKIVNEADKGSKTAKVILKFLKNPDVYLSSIQVGMTLISLIEGYYGGQVLARWLEPILLKFEISSWLANALSLLLSIGGITYLSIVIGELLPKTIALRNPQRTAFFLTPAFRIFTLIALPFVKILTASTHFLLRLWGGEKSENHILTNDDLKGLLGMAYRQGTLEKEELKIHENIFSFYDLVVETIMIEKDKVIAIDQMATRKSIEAILRGSKHNYFPLLNSRHKVVGILCSRDFFMNPQKSLTDLFQSTCTIKSNQTAPELLKAFKTKKKNFAVVTNDRKDFIGIVTMYDLGRALIGKFQ